MKTLMTLGLAAALLGGAAYGGPVKVGMITTLSGGGAGLGVDMRDGFALALKLAGDEAADVTLITEDDQQKPDVGVQVADRMIQQDNVDLLAGIVFSNVAVAVVPAATAQGKFFLSANAGPSQLAGANCNPNYFSVSYQNDNLHEGAGQAATDLGYHKVFVMAPNYPAGTDAINGFRRYYTGDLAGEVYTQLTQTDYAGEIAQIRDSGADALFFFLPGGLGISFMKQYAASGLEVPIVAPAFSFSQDVLPAMGDAALGVRNASTWSPDLDNPANAAFVEAFKAEYGRIPSIYAAQGFDTANLILSASKVAEVADADAFRDALRQADFASVRGNFRFGPDQHPIQDLYLREVVKDADGTLTNRIVAPLMTAHGNAYSGDCKM